MRDEEIAAVRGKLEDFVAEVFASLPRRDQRAKGSLYLRGLMLDGRRKSMQPMAERLGVDHQQLQQFVASSTWAVEPVRRRLANLAVQTIGPEAWVIDDTGFKKDGPSSPCVARQYSGTLGKIGNCQIGVSVHAATDAASCPLDWRLYVPEAWDDTCAETNEAAASVQARRERAGIPDTVRHRTKWSQALEMIDELKAWGLVPPVVVADAGYGEVTAFRQGLTDRGIPHVLAVKASTSARPANAAPEPVPYSGRGPRGADRYRESASSLRDLALASGRKQLRQATWRHGTKNGPGNRTAAMKSRFLALRIRPANRDIPLNEDRSLPEAWMLAEWPAHEPAPTDYWLSDLPADTPLKTLVRLAKMRWRIEHDYRELKTGLGLAHFEGRSFTGWHRHATLVTAAHLFITRLRLTNPKADGAA
ncbi:IS701 family transposase [Pseudarthrobacter sp. H3Y2-7]|uniref:IS701 family transposase n=1 Tax=Pseudarthrobacter naphthalenicus TaxID=3031328 RepID=UPI0023AE8509|nr:IS701 family transposase [Pseudarthrobacter sp. H3Y2-7]MDE8667809.1 IS701 family transposase [Pseudarthrobacter sp. H3Y2-7]